MPTIDKILGVAQSNISHILGVAKSSLDSVLGMDFPASFVNAKAFAKSISTGTTNAFTFTDTSDDLNFVQTDAFSISMWIKAGWSSSLNTNIHFIIGRSGSTFQLEDMIKVIYKEDQNRIQFFYGHKNSKTSFRKIGEWLFHSQATQYKAGYDAAGLGTTYWSSSNRGYSNSEGYTLITVTKSTTDNTSGMTLYWNANSAGAPPIGTNQTAGSPMSTTNDRQWSLGSNGVFGSNDEIKCGNNTATAYDGLTIWDKELSSSEVTELYNSGTPMDAETHSASSNLVGYWNFEDNGTDEINGNNFEEDESSSSTYVSI